MKKLIALLALLPFPALGMGEFDGLYECKMPEGFDAILYNVVVTSNGQTGIVNAAPVKTTKRTFQGHAIGVISDGVFAGISGTGKHIKAEFSGSEFRYESSVTDKNGKVIQSTITCIKSW